MSLRTSTAHSDATLETQASTNRASDAINGSFVNTGEEIGQTFETICQFDLH